MAPPPTAVYNSNPTTGMSQARCCQSAGLGILGSMGSWPRWCAVNEDDATFQHFPILSELRRSTSEAVIRFLDDFIRKLWLVNFRHIVAVLYFLSASCVQWGAKWTRSTREQYPPDPATRWRPGRCTRRQDDSCTAANIGVLRSMRSEFSIESFITEFFWKKHCGNHIELFGEIVFFV